MKPRFVLVCFAFLALATIAGGCGNDDSPTAPKKSAAVDSWSGNKIVFTMPAGLSVGLGSTVTVTTGSGKSTTHQIDITPPNTYAVITHETMDQHPCWSSVDNYIYFSSTRVDNNWNIRRTTAIGGSPEQVTFDPGLDLYPDINPSSHELAWSSSRTFGGANPERDPEIFHGYIPCSPPIGLHDQHVDGQRVARPLSVVRDHRLCGLRHGVNVGRGRSDRALHRLEGRVEREQRARRVDRGSATELFSQRALGCLFTPRQLHTRGQHLRLRRAVIFARAQRGGPFASRYYS